MLSPLLNFQFLSNLGKIPYNVGSLGINCSLRRKFTQQIWKENTNEIIQKKGKIIVIEDEENWEKALSVIFRYGLGLLFLIII